jgi:hypothetical protein
MECVGDESKRNEHVIEENGRRKHVVLTSPSGIRVNGDNLENWSWLKFDNDRPYR